MLAAMVRTEPEPVWLLNLNGDSFIYVLFRLHKRIAYTEEYINKSIVLYTIWC
jgi:hypothetical protein